MRVDPASTADGFQAITGGMDAGNNPSIIGRLKVAFARNVTFRLGSPSTRPGWLRRTLTFLNVDTQNAFEDGLYQGFGSFEPFQGGLQLVGSIAGRIYAIDILDSYRVKDITPGLASSTTEPKAWVEQAEDFAIVQNGVQAPVIYDGSGSRRVDPSSVPKEVPVGTAMVYGNGRLWVALPGGKAFVAGNIVYGEDGTAPYDGRDAVLKFSENDFLNGGGAFGIPFNAGSIRAIRALANLDTSLGQGPIQIFTERGAFSVNAPFLRDDWATVRYPIQTTSLLGSGAQSHEATALVNGDIWLRSEDGIRSFQVARRDFGSWVNTPLSSEVSPVIGTDDRSLLLHASAALFDNRFLMTVNPFRVRDHGIAHRGLIALDFHSVSGIGVRSTPIYDGLWTGLDILQIIPVKDRCFMFALNPADDDIELWELTRDDPHDNRSTRIACFIDTPSFGFEDAGWDRKELSTGDVWIDDVRGTVNFDVDFRPDRYPGWIDWHTFSVDAKDETCLTANTCGIVTSLQPQYRTRLRLPLPSDSCNARVNAPFRNGFEFQTRLAWTGHTRITRLRLVAHRTQEDAAPYCEPSESTDTDGITACDTSLFSYRADA